MKNGASKTHIAIALTCIYVVWGSTYLAIRYAVETMPPFLMASSRFLFSGSILYIWLRWRGAKNPSWVQWRSAFIIGGLLLVGGNGCVVWAEQSVPSGLAALLVSIAPLWMAFFNWVRPNGERPSALTTLGLILGFVGLIVLIGPRSLHIGEGFSWATLAIIVAPITWALGSVYSKQAPHPESPFMSTAIQMLSGGVLLLIVGLLMNEWPQLQWASFSAKSWWALLYLIVGGSLIGFTSYIWLLKHVPLSLASTYAYVNPVVAVLLGCFLAGETLSPNAVMGGAIILLAVAIITFKPAQ